MNKLPKARTTNILVQEIENEVMIYDTITDKAYCLNETSSIVFNAANGKTTFEELKNKLPEDIIFLALDGLQKENLLDRSTGYVSPFIGISRRDVIRRIGLTSMIALPLVSGIIAPIGTNAASRAFAPGSRSYGQSCTRSSECVSSASNCYFSACRYPVGSRTLNQSCVYREECSSSAPNCASYRCCVPGSYGFAPNTELNGVAVPRGTCSNQPSLALNCCSGQIQYSRAATPTADYCKCV